MEGPFSGADATARYYALTGAGEEKLEEGRDAWARATEAVGRILQAVS